jgi:hypothetical protein
MKNKGILITSIFLIVTTGNYFRLYAESNIRLVEFVNIIAIGALLGVLIVQITKAIKDRNK